MVNAYCLKKMLLFILASAVFGVNAEFRLEPLIKEAVVGEFTYFYCTTTAHTNEVNFYHYGVGAKNHEDICIYCLGKVHPKYINRIEVQLHSNTYRLLINPVLWADAGRYMCQDNGGIGVSLTAQLVVLDVNPNNSVSVHGPEEIVICSANSSQSCSYTWIWVGKGHDEVVSKSSTLIPRKPGWYKCEAECSVRGRPCTVLSRQILVTDDPGLSKKAAIAISVILMITVELVIFGLVCRSKRFRQWFLKSQGNILTNGARLRRSDDQEQSDIDSDESERSIGVRQHSIAITTKCAKENKLLIRGMAIIDDELFVVTQSSSEVEVFNCKSLISSRQWTLEGLIRPADICSCKSNRCLYIMDWKNDSMKKEVLCADTNGKLLRSWITGDDYGNVISVSNEDTVIVTCFGKTEFNEYSPQGEMIRKISLQGSEFPTHAVKLSNGEFMVSGGDISHLLHRVCIVNVLGKVQKSFGGEKGSDWTQLHYPMHFAVFTDGSVAVLDNGNQRVLLLGRDLQFNRILLSHTIHGLQNPTRLLLNESHDLLFVVDSHNGAGEILVFHLKEILSM